MQIYRPVKTNRITQHFGENNACARVDDNGNAIIPYQIVTKSGTTCPSGYKGLYELLGMKGHAGIDFDAKRREPIYFDIDIDGIEWEAQPIYSESGGYGVLIRSKQPIPLDKAPEMPGASLNLVKRQYDALGGVHLMRYYGHLDEATHLKSRQSVKFGDFVGLAGTTGASSGVHVHRHLVVCGPNVQNPFFYLDGDSDYKGRIDESEWLKEDFARDVFLAKEEAKKAILKARELIRLVRRFLNV